MKFRISDWHFKMPKFKLLKNKRLRFLIIFLFFALIFLFNLNFLTKIPEIWPDEALIADTSFNFLKHGNFGSDLLSGTMPGVEKFGISYPPVFFLLGALWFKILGLSAYSFRTLSLILGFIFIYFFYKTAIRLTDSKTHKLSSVQALMLFLSICLLFLDESFVRAIHIARPEILVALFGFVALNLYFKSFEARSEKWRDILLLYVGFFLGLSFLSHYLAVIFIGSITLHQIFLAPKTFFKSRGFYMFLLSLAFPVLTWIIWNHSAIAYTLNNSFLRLAYRTNATGWLWVVLGNSSLTTKLIYIFYFITLWELIAAAIFKRSSRKVLILLLLGFSWVGSYLWQTFYAFVFVVIFTYLAIFVMLSSDVAEKQPLLRFKRNSLAVLFSILFVLNLCNSINLYALNWGDNFSYDQYTSELLEVIPEGASVYISAIPDPYFALKGLNKISEFPVLPTSIQQLEKVLDSADYIILNNPLEVITTGSVVMPYAQTNALGVKNIGGENQYRATVIKLKPRNERVSGQK